MIITFTPAEGDEQTWEWDSGDVRTSEAELIESTFEGPLGDWNMQLLLGSITARKILLWRLRCREHPKMRLADVDFAARELKVDFNAEELQEFRDAIEAARNVPESKRIKALEWIDRQIEEAPASPGKAPSGNSPTDTA